MWLRVPGSDPFLGPFKPLFAYYRELQTQYGDAKVPAAEDEGKTENMLPEPSPAPKAPAGDSATTPAQDDPLDKEPTREHNKVVTAQAILNLIHGDLNSQIRFGSPSGVPRKEKVPFAIRRYLASLLP